MTNLTATLDELTDATTLGSRPLSSARRRALQWIVGGGGLFATLLGLAVLTGWLTHNDTLIQVNPHWVGMPFNTALGFLCCGIGLLAATYSLQTPTLITGTYAAGIGFLTLVEYIFHVDLHIDQLLLSSYSSFNNPYPGRVALNSALCLLLCGTALLMLSRRASFRGRPLALGLIGSVIASIGTVAFIGYMSGLEGAYGWINFSAMSAHSALGFIMLGLGISTIAWLVDSEEHLTLTGLPLLVCVSVATGSLILFQALSIEERPHRFFSQNSSEPNVPLANSALPEIILIGGLALAFLLGLTVYLGQTASRRLRVLDTINERLETEINERTRFETALVKEQHFLTTLLDSLTEGVIACDADGNMILFNKTSRIWHDKPDHEGPEDSGPSSEWTQKYGLFQIDGEQQFAPDQVPLIRALNGETLQNSELILRTAKGDRIVKINAQPIVNEAGEKLGAVAAMHDITERKRAENALAESEGRYRAAAENSFDAFYIMQCVRDENGGIIDFQMVDCNSQGAAMMAKTREHMLGQPVFGNLNDGRAAAFFEQYKQVVESGQAMKEEHRALTPGMTAHWIRSQVVPLSDGVAVTASDITHRKVAEEKLRAFAADLERSNRELQDFASVASHDLQEPLRKIQAFGDRLKNRCEADLSDEGKLYLDRMQDAAGRMSILINDLLAFSRVTTKARPFISVDLNKTVREVLSDLEILLAHSGGSVEVGELPTLESDEVQMRQLFQNLIGNALKFARAGVAPVVTISAEIVSDRCCVAVSDNGIGFEQKYVDRIFTVFQRLHGRQEYEGTGIGLAICRKIVERHGGTITAESTPGEGATFTVVLPLKQKSES